MKKRDRHQEETGAQWLRGMYELLKAGAISGVTAVLVLLVCAFLVSGGMLKDAWMGGVVMAACVFGAMTGGVYAARKIRKRYLLVGLAVGGVLFLLLLTAGMLAYGGTAEENVAGILSACMCGGGIAGILSSKPEKKRRR